MTFGTIIADCVRPGKAPQVLVIEPTREVALQTQRIVEALCSELPCKVRRAAHIGLNAALPSRVSGVQARCCAFVGGLSVEADGSQLRRGCQVVVGTPGRLRALLELGHLRVEALRVLVRSNALSGAPNAVAGHRRGGRAASWRLR